MRTLPRIVSASLLLAIVLLPLGVFGDQLPAPMVEKVSVGTTVVQFYGQNLRFTTPEPLRVQLDPVDATHFRLTVRVMGGSGGPGAGYEILDIYWTDFGTTVYNGPTPSGEPWTGVLNTESGFTEK